MKVTQVSIRPTEAALEAGAPALTPELLAASGARYSRNNEGLETILSKIDPENLDKSVDSIFRMIDYGHQSIADMAPVAMFMDGLSQWLAYLIWSICPTAGGQESSTRYIKLGMESLIPADALGIPDNLQAEWEAASARTMDAYARGLEAWTSVSEACPHLMRLPAALLADDSEKAAKTVNRLRRNYGFDRARYYLSSAASTNVMMVMSARAWAALCQHLCSHALPEAQALGNAIREQLALCAPRLMKHATAKDSLVHGLKREFESLSARAAQGLPPHLAVDAGSSECPPLASLQVLPPPGVDPSEFTSDLEFHENRYAWIGPSLRRTAVRFGWDAVSLAELRDLNRHRTGNKHCEMRPVGFYSGLDQLPEDRSACAAEASLIEELNAMGRDLCTRAHALLAAGDPSYVYWLPLGAQLPFEHVTTADKFIYEAELRTGMGAHYRYARHLHDALVKWYELYPQTRSRILEGEAEPE